MSDHYQKLQQLYVSAPSHAWCAASISVDYTMAELQLKVENHLFHGADAVHGSILFKLLDDAAFFAVQSIEKEFFVLTTSFDIKFCRPATSGLLIAKGELVLATSSHCFAEAKVYNDKGKLVAFGSGEFTRSRMLLSDQEHYR